MKRCRDLLLIVVLAALTFGGSFTCHASTHDHDDDPKPKPVAPARK